MRKIDFFFDFLISIFRDNYLDSPTHNRMPAATDCCYRYPSTTSTTKNPCVKLEEVEGEHTCAFCRQRVYLSTRVKVNPSVGFVCRDCSKPKPCNELTPKHPHYVLVPKLWGLYREQVPRTSLSHYQTCNGTGCEHRIITGEVYCSLQCASFPEYRGCSPASTRMTSSSDGWTGRRWM